MTVVNIYDAKTQLSKLIDEAAGNDMIIARRQISGAIYSDCFG
jgi:antitoxin (DNA-binding transcriptional repressor) of toxin-antitoxin stability system